jgi:hypothetical protein
MHQQNLFRRIAYFSVITWHATFQTSQYISPITGLMKFHEPFYTIFRYSELKQLSHPSNKTTPVRRVMVNKETVVPLASWTKKLHYCQFGFKIRWYLMHLKVGIAFAYPFHHIIPRKSGTVSLQRLVPIGTLAQRYLNLLARTRSHVRWTASP